jgi:tetratricopeptide (TPR) repeat protein/transcriptional regulator with XRE-family HTH domain
MPEKRKDEANPNRLLRQARIKSGWTQAEIASRINTDTQNVSRWERGTTKPTLYYRRKLCELFEQSAEALGLLSKPVPLGSLDLYDPAIPPFPYDLEQLIGRDDLLAQLKERLVGGRSTALSALNGLPGVGKTALAVAVAHDEEIQSNYQDGLLWVGLGPEPDIMSQLARWGELLGLSREQMGRLSSLRTWAFALRAAIGQRHMLLIIDDAWHINDALAFQVDAPGCVYLLTTRFPRLAATFARAGVITVPELGEEDGIALLGTLAPKAIAGRQDMARSLVRLVGGLPLALTLVGRHLYVQASSGQPRRTEEAVKQVQDTLSRLRLREPVSFAEHPPVLPPGMPLSLQAIIGASVQRLDVDAQAALHALGLFPAKPNSFSETAALAVSAVSVDVLDTLCDVGLLESYGPDRYTLHQTIADYTQTMSVHAEARERLAAYFADFVEQHAQDYMALEQESRNILAALTATYLSGQRAALVQRVLAFTGFLLARGMYAQAEQHFKRAQEVAKELNDPQGLVDVLMYLGEINEKRGEYQAAIHHLEEALALAHASGDVGRACIILRVLGMVSVLCVGYDRANQYYQEGLALARQLADPKQIAGFLNNLGNLSSARGRYTEALSNLEEGMALAREIQHREWITVFQLNLGNLALQRGLFTQAERYLLEGLALARDSRLSLWTCLLLFNLGAVATEQGNYEEAQMYLEEGMVLARKMDHPEQIAYHLAAQAELAGKQGDFIRARACIHEAWDYVRLLGHQELTCGLLAIEGDISLLEGQVEEAEAAYSKMRKHLPQGNVELRGQALYGLARVAEARGDIPQALRLGRASRAMLVSIGHRQAIQVRQWLAKLSKVKHEGGTETILPSSL